MDQILTHIPWEVLKVEKVLSESSSGTVSLGDWCGVIVAIKTFNLQLWSPAAIEEFKRDASILAKANFPHVVTLFGVSIDPGYSLILEYLPKGSLFSFLKEPKPVSWIQNLQLSTEIAKGLSFLHSQNILHRQLKSSNILLDEGLHIKITGFGFLQIKTETRNTTPNVLTSRWRSPESLRRFYRQSPSSDVYSLGMVLWEIATCQVPYVDETDDLNVVEMIMSGKKEIIPDDCPLEFSSIIEQCWNDQPSFRPTSQELLKWLIAVQLDMKSNPISTPSLPPGIQPRRPKPTLLIPTESSNVVSPSFSPMSSPRRQKPATVVEQSLSPPLLSPRRQKPATMVEQSFYSPPSSPTLSPRRQKPAIVVEQTPHSPPSISCSVAPPIISRAPLHPPGGRKILPQPKPLTMPTPVIEIPLYSDRTRTNTTVTPIATFGEPKSGGWNVPELPTSFLHRSNKENPKTNDELRLSPSTPRTFLVSKPSPESPISPTTSRAMSPRLQNSSPRETATWRFKSQFLPHSKEPYQLLEPSQQEFNKVKALYDQHPVPYHDIGSLKIIYNPSFDTVFECYLQNLQHKSGMPEFQCKLSEESNSDWRKKTLKQLAELGAKHNDPKYANITIIPAWHGTSPEHLDSIFKIGYSNLAVTDSGYFGKGIYSTCEAEYAHNVYSKAYPVIDGDVKKLVGRSNYQNYDAHFIPVVPKNPFKVNEKYFIPCKVNEKNQFTELVVFQSSACLPRYLIELQRSLSCEMLKTRPSKYGGMMPYQHGQGLFLKSKFREALPYLQCAAEEGYAPALLRLGCIYLSGDMGIPKDLVKSSAYFQQVLSSAAWFEKKAKQGGCDEIYNWAVFNHYSVNDQIIALKCYKISADDGCLLACDSLGVCWQNGIGGNKNDGIAAHYFRLAAEQGLAQSQCNLGVCHANGKGVEQDSQLALKYYQLSASQGYAPALFNLAICFKNGMGVPKDEEKSLGFLNQARQQNYAPALFNLGVYCQNGSGVPQDEPLAMKYYQAAADQGHAEAQFNLAVSYETGNVVKDQKKAVHHYTQCADQGYAPGLFHLGLCYKQGNGVKVSLKTAAKYFQSAADQGHPKAQDSLGVCYLTGKGVAKNEQQAVKYFQLASEQGHERAKLELTSVLLSK